jgi:hypothetical protein
MSFWGKNMMENEKIEEMGKKKGIKGKKGKILVKG